MRHATEKCVHNLHVPLPEHLYDGLKQAAAEASRPLTELAREAISIFVRERERQRLRREICEYARSVAGSTDDLDPDLEVEASRHVLDGGHE